MSLIDVESTARTGRFERIAIAVVAVFVAFLTATAAYLLGRQHDPDDKWLVGTAYVGDRQVSVRVDGWSYGIVSSVSWIAADGELEESGWPSCFKTIGSEVRFRFKAARVTTPDGTFRPVTLVDCRNVS